jgi:Ca2+-binding RTX toxin-like protein
MKNRSKKSRTAIETLEGRVLLSFGNNSATDVLPTVDLGQVTLPFAKNGTLRIFEASDNSGGDTSRYEIQTFLMTMPANGPATAKFVFKASQAKDAISGYIVKVYKDDAANSPGVFNKLDDTLVNGLPTFVNANQTVTSNPVPVQAGARYFIQMVADVPPGQQKTSSGDTGASTVNFDLSLLSGTPAVGSVNGAGLLTVNGTTGNDVIDVSVSGGNVVVKVGNNSQTFTAADVKRLLVNAGNGNDKVNLHTVNVPSSINGGNGNDSLIGGANNDSFDGGNGADLIDGGVGGTGDDVHYFTRTENLVVTLDDVANDGGASDSNADNVKSNIEVVQGGSGNDRFVGSAANNALAGNGGNDTLLAGDGNDVLLGGLGDDLLDGGFGADVLDGDLGSDTATYASRNAGVNVSLDTSGTGGEKTGNDGNASDGLAGQRDNVRDDVENVIGGKKSDVITGSAFGNHLIGGKGNDRLIGLGGADLLEGGLGNDTCEGGDGKDVLHGNAGNDSLVGGAMKDKLFGDAGTNVLLQ